MTEYEKPQLLTIGGIDVRMCPFCGGEPFQPHDHAAVNNKLAMAHNALKQAQLVQTIGGEDE